MKLNMLQLYPLMRSTSQPDYLQYNPIKPKMISKINNVI